MTDLVGRTNSDPTTMTSPVPTPPADVVADSGTASLFRSPRIGVEFLTSLNHAIRTPLSGILGLSELMLENPTDTENSEYIHSIRSCAAGLNDLLSTTLDYVAHASGAIWLEEQDFLLSIAVESGLRDARQRAEDNGAAFEPGELSGLDQVVRADALRVRDLVALVARVAIHSASLGQVRFRAALTPWGPRFGELTLDAWRETQSESEIEMSAQTDFAPPEDLFSGAFRIENLEIALIYRLVKLLRGTIRINPEPHAPIAVRVTLPIRLRGADRPADRGDESPAHPSILIVDDNQISLRILCGILSRAEFDSVAVASGQAALEALAHRNFDMVLLDLAMPGMDGGVTTARIRALPNCADIAVVGITAGVTEELRQNCRRNGMDAILSKPVDAEGLVASVRFYLNGAVSGKTRGYDRID